MKPMVITELSNRLGAATDACDYRRPLGKGNERPARDLRLFDSEGLMASVSLAPQDAAAGPCS
ncbi:MAG: hypothetical protein NVSMB6_10970 [Burkholderiaceae bacterium]